MAANQDFAGRVIGAASQGAVGALVAASLSAVTEPIVNSLLVKRSSVSEAVKELDPERVKNFLKTTLATNFIKFPFFEVTNMIMNSFDLPGAVRGTATGIVFTSCTLPLTNYRYCKSMGMPVDSNALFKAYLPTVLRDIVYGIARNFMQGTLNSSFPEMAKTTFGRFIIMFCTVAFSCIISAPGNEYRGYCLQPPERRKSFAVFFKPQNFVRSTSVGALIMSTSLGVGTVVTGPVQSFVYALQADFAKNPTLALLVALMLVQQSFNQQVVKAIKAKKEE